MPIPIYGEFNTSSNIRQVKSSGASYDYDYPYGLKLKPGSELHELIVKEVLMRARESHDVMSSRYDSWREIDETLTAYIPADEEEAIVKSKDRRKPVSVVIPQSYAILEILLTYASAALLEDPIFRYEGVGPEDQYGSILLESLVNHQAYRTKMFLSLHTFLRDIFAYGLGACSPVWVKQTGLVGKKKQSVLDRLLGRVGSQREFVVETIYEGNEIDNIDPYKFLPDVNTSISKINDGEYAGWVSRSNLTSLLKEEKDDEWVFNYKYLKHIENPVSIFGHSDESGRSFKSGVEPSTRTTTVKSVDTVYMYIDLIPEDWKLPGGSDNKKGEYPETWFFGVSGDSVVTLCNRITLNHGKKPIVTGAADYDGYSIAPISRLEIVKGLQTITDWMINSHVINVRKALNDMLVVDPSLINMKDLEDPEPGKLIKIRRAAWGRGIKDAVMQLAVSDVTRANVNDAAITMELMKNLSGAVDSLSGQRRKTSERVTAEEVKTDKVGGLGRLERVVRIIGTMAFQDLGTFLASHTQQFMSEETSVKIIGDRVKVLEQEYGMTGGNMMVSPLDILINYDVRVKDGSIPGGNYSDGWTQMLPIILQDPEIRQSKDVVKLIDYILRNSGVKNPHQFDRQIQPQVMPDEQAMAQVQAGNLVPMGG